MREEGNKIENMFCFQCEQTGKGGGCTGSVGTCGKSAGEANLQDKLTGALIGLARAVDGHKPTASAHKVMMEGLFTTITNVNFNEETRNAMLEAVQKEIDAIDPSVGTSMQYDMDDLWKANEDVRSPKASFCSVSVVSPHMRITRCYSATPTMR